MHALQTEIGGRGTAFCSKFMDSRGCRFESIEKVDIAWFSCVRFKTAFA